MSTNTFAVLLTLTLSSERRGNYDGAISSERRGDLGEVFSSISSPFSRERMKVRVKGRMEVL